MPEAPESLPPPRCWAEVDLAALSHNADVCREMASCDLMAIVKADAYGHGLEEVARELAPKVASFGVANVREALRSRKALREANPPVLILSPATPEEMDAIVQGGFSASVSSQEEVFEFSTVARQRKKMARLHAVADTGMGRMGCRPSEFSALVQSIQKNDFCELEGVDTHFPSADEDAGFTREQIAEFEALVKSVSLPEKTQVHLANSAGMIGFGGEMPFATVARPGLALYGISPLPELASGLRPVLSWKARVGLVREIPAGTSISYGRTFVSQKPMRVATLGAGYGDGYPRHLSGKNAPVLIAGRRCPILGRVTMDQIVVDISDVETPVTAGDEAVLLGCQGDDAISAAEIASLAGTIPWEVLTGITGRVERVYC